MLITHIIICCSKEKNNLKNQTAFKEQIRKYKLEIKQIKFRFI